MQATAPHIAKAVESPENGDIIGISAAGVRTSLQHAATNGRLLPGTVTSVGLIQARPNRSLEPQPRRRPQAESLHLRGGLVIVLALRGPETPPQKK
jgi:hypothetical protein